MESERSIIDLIETGKSSVLFDEIDFQLQFLLRFSDRLQGGRQKKKRSLFPMKVVDGDDCKALTNIKLEISSCLKVIDLCTSSIGTDLELSVKHRQLILGEVIAPCLFHSIEFTAREVSTHLSSLQCLQECLLCTVLLLLSRKEESGASQSSSHEYIFDARVQISTPLLLLLCSYRPTLQAEAESTSKSNTHLSNEIPSVTNIHKKRKKTTSLQPTTAALDIKRSIDDYDDTKNRTIPTISEILTHFGVSVKAIQDQVFQHQQNGCSLYEIMTLLLISRLLTAKIHTWASVDLSHTQASPEYSAPVAACGKNSASQEESLAFLQSLLRTSIENADLKCAHEDSYLKLICVRYLQDEHMRNFSLQTANYRQLILLTLSILEMACYQCVENQEFVGNLKTNSELISTDSSGGSITPCPLLQSLCSIIYRMSERIASLPSLCLALSPSYEYEGIAEEELLLASLRMVVACSNTSDFTCSEILHCPLPSSLSMAEWLSAFIMQALIWEGQLFQVRLELKEKPAVAETVTGTDLSQYVSLAGPLSPTETSVERFVFDLSLSLLALLSNLLRGAESICIADSLPTFLLSVTLRLIDEFMSDLIDTDDVINLANPSRGAEDVNRNNVLDNSLPVAELVLSAHVVLLLFIICENNPSSEIAVTNSLPRRSWWLPIRVLKGFISLQGQAGVLLRENLQLVIDCISKMATRDTARFEGGAVIAEKGQRWGLVNMDAVEESSTVQDADFINIEAATSQVLSPPCSSLKEHDQEMRWVWDGSDFVWTNSMVAEKKSYSVQRQEGAKDLYPLCVMCKRFHGTIENVQCCSLCFKMATKLVVENVAITPEILHTFDKTAFLKALENEMRVFTADEFALSHLDLAVRVLCIPDKTFLGVKRVIMRTAATNFVSVTPQSLADMLDDSLGMSVFMSAQQCAEIIDILRTSCTGEISYLFYHVLCFRCIERWRLSQMQHGIGHCYYGIMNGSLKSEWYHVINTSDASATATSILKKLYINKESGFAHENFGAKVGRLAHKKIVSLS